MTTNHAAFLDGKSAKLRVGEAEMPKPGPSELVIKTHAVAINPVDWKIQDYGFMIQTWPTIIGEDVTGIVHEVGSNVTKFKRGDRVVSHAVMFIKGDIKYGGFQEYVLAEPNFTAMLPGNVSFTEGAVMPLALDAAAVGLFNSIEQGGLGLSLPSLNMKPSGKTIVVWGGSSSVGAQAVQLAVAAGAKVIATASQKNHAFVKSLGATEAFDYNSSTIVSDVLSAIKSAGGDFIGALDAISLPESYQYTVPIVEKAGGTQLAIVTPTEPENVPKRIKVGIVFAVNPLVQPLWNDFITPALEKGVLKAVPEALVVGKGLESVQKGFDEHKNGVNAKKIVVEI